MSANVFNDFVNWKNLEELEHQQLVLDALMALREGWDLSDDTIKELWDTLDTLIAKLNPKDGFLVVTNQILGEAFPI